MSFIGRITALCAIVGLVFLVSACGDDDTPTSPTPTPAAPTTTEHYIGTLGVGASGFYSFSVSQYGTVNVTLSLTPVVDDPAVMVALGLGTPSRFDCSANAITTAAGPTPQISGAYNPGIYCVRLADAGNLTGPARFDIAIAHP